MSVSPGRLHGLSWPLKLAVRYFASRARPPLGVSLKAGYIPGLLLVAGKQHPRPATPRSWPQPHPLRVVGERCTSSRLRWAWMDLQCNREIRCLQTAQTSAGARSVNHVPYRQRSYTRCASWPREPDPPASGDTGCSFESTARVFPPLGRAFKGPRRVACYPGLFKLSTACTRWSGRWLTPVKQAAAQHLEASVPASLQGRGSPHQEFVSRL